jgi:hypothetical protein
MKKIIIIAKDVKELDSQLSQLNSQILKVEEIEDNKYEIILDE